MTQSPTMTDEADLERLFERHVAQLEREAELRTEDEDDQTFRIGLRDGFDDAVQWLDRLTGGDGEYVASTFSERDCRTAAEMGLRIVARLRQAEAERDALRAALDPNETKAAYIGEIKFTTTEFDEFGAEHTVHRTLEWTTTKDVMKMVSARARHLLASAS